MNKNAIISDQLYNWSENEPLLRFPWHTASATPSPDQAAAPARTIYSARFLDRTLQTLWQTRLQVCPGPRSRSQVLFVGQPARHATGDGLRASAVRSTGLRVPPQLPTSTSSAGANLQRKSRVIAASGEVLTFSENGAFGIPARFGHGREARRQLSSKLAASRRGPRTSSSADPSS
jgi:hypothetical protein